MQISSETPRRRDPRLIATVGTVHVRDLGNGMEFALWGEDASGVEFAVTLSANEIELLARVLAKARQAEADLQARERHEPDWA